MLNTKKRNFEIWTHNLTKIYGKSTKRVKAVDHINMALEPGIHGFLGPNGAGKTSTLNMLVGAISFTSGTAKIRSHSIGSLKSRRLLGFLPQDPSFYETMSGPRYLLHMAQLSGIRKHMASQKVKELIKFMGLEEAKDRPIRKYSGGMKQKIGIAAALIHEPKILILDEPTANLDPMARADLISKIKQLSEKMSVFVSSHILSEVEQMCENVYVINKGKIILADSIKNIKRMHSESANIFVLDTDFNEEVLELLKSNEYISKSWIRDSDGKICILAKDNKRLQKEIPKMVMEREITFKGFYQEEASLQDIFVNLIEGDF